MAANGRPDERPAFVLPDDDHYARCGGLMVVRHYIDLQDDTGQIDMTALRCTSCGEVIDAVILRNRVQPTPNLLYGTKQRKYAQHVGEDGSHRSNRRTDSGRQTGEGN